MPATRQCLSWPTSTNASWGDRKSLHQVDVQTGTGKTAEDYEHHRIATDEQQQDRHPDPGKEFLERDAHQPQALRRLKRDERRAQTDINREHAANPDDCTEYV